MEGKDKIAIMQMFEHGKKIERIDMEEPMSNWIIDNNPEWNWQRFNYREYKANRKNKKIINNSKPISKGILYFYADEKYKYGRYNISDYAVEKLETGKKYYVQIYEYENGAE